MFLKTEAEFFSEVQAYVLCLLWKKIWSQLWKKCIKTLQITIFVLTKSSYQLGIRFQLFRKFWMFHRHTLQSFEVQCHIQHSCTTTPKLFSTCTWESGSGYSTFVLWSTCWQSAFGSLKRYENRKADLLFWPHVQAWSLGSDYSNSTAEILIDGELLDWQYYFLNCRK